MSSFNYWNTNDLFLSPHNPQPQPHSQPHIMNSNNINTFNFNGTNGNTTRSQYGGGNGSNKAFSPLMSTLRSNSITSPTANGFNSISPTNSNNGVVSNNNNNNTHLAPQLLNDLLNSPSSIESKDSFLSSLSSTTTNTTTNHTNSLPINNGSLQPFFDYNSAFEISSRRPSYQAEFLDYKDSNNNNTNQFSQLGNTNNNNNNFYTTTTSSNINNNTRLRSNSLDYLTNFIVLENGLLLDKLNNKIISSNELKLKYYDTLNYFGNFNYSLSVINDISSLYENNNSQLSLRVNKLINYLILKNSDLNYLFFKNYSLILNKNGKLDIISIPQNSNLKLIEKDLILIEGDRGKDLVMILKPIIDFKFALIFNYLKKRLHLKSLKFGNSNQKIEPKSSSPNTTTAPAASSTNTNATSNKPSIINDDENFITLPNKQILRFVKPFEINQLTSKYNDELIAYKICIDLVKLYNLNLIIKNVEFQFDKKKLIIYYYCFDKIDFRLLIKHLFKIYKTRIWLCAIIPIEKTYEPLILNKVDDLNQLDEVIVHDSFPINENISSFNEIDSSNAIYFHSKIFKNLINWFRYEMTNDEIFNRNYNFLS